MNRIGFYILSCLIVLLLAFSTLFVVDQRQFAVVYALGEIKENEGDLSGALADYLRTVAVFYHDSSAVSAAQERANALLSRKVTVP